MIETETETREEQDRKQAEQDFLDQKQSAQILQLYRLLISVITALHKKDLL